jgi:hypothetical protein
MEALELWRWRMAAHVHKRVTERRAAIYWQSYARYECRAGA